jgi:hypothetical protein
MGNAYAVREDLQSALSWAIAIELNRPAPAPRRRRMHLGHIHCYQLACMHRC